MQIQSKHIIERKFDNLIKQLGIVSFDDDNLYPQNINDICNGSGTTINCLERLESFLIGKGLSNKVIENLKINSIGDTNGDLLSLITKDFAKFRGFTIWRKINENFKTVELYHIPFEWIRFVQDVDNENNITKYCIYNDWAQKKGRIKKENFQYAWAWSENSDVIQEQINADGSLDNYSGQLLYISADGNGVYPLSIVDSIQEDCIVDNQMKIFNYKNITTNFLSSHFLFFKDEPKEDVKFALENSIRKFQGADNASKFNILYGVAENEVSLKKVDIQNHDKLFENTNNVTKENIRERFGQNLPFFKGGLNSSDMSGEAIKTTYAFYNSLTLKNRTMLENTLKYILKDYYLSLNLEFIIEPLTFEL